MSSARLHRVTESFRVAGAAARGVTRSGLVRPTSPRAALQLTTGVVRWGTSPAVGFSLGAARHGEEPAVVDVDDSTRMVVSFADLEYRCTMFAQSLLDRGIGPDTTVGILGRNSRSFLETVVAVSRTGADLVYFNTSFSAEQVRSVVDEYHIELVVCDQDLQHLLPENVSYIGLDHPSGVELLASLPGNSQLPAASRSSRHIILTSGTTSGTARGAARSGVPLDAAAAVIDAFPVHMRDTALIAAPLFHAWGWMHHRLATLLDMTSIVMRRPDPERILALIEQYQVDTLVTAPVVLKRLLVLPPDVRRRYDTSSLRCVAVSGSALPGTLAIDFMDEFGDVLYNLYGSTEAAFATCATPADLRTNPATAGKPLAGVHVEVLDVKGRAVPRGVEGRVHVGSRTTFTGYTDGSDRPRIRGLVFTGDIGTLDGDGRLTIVGRADEVIVTGGENVHPAEVEEVLRTHPNVADVAVVGIADPVYGAILQAHVVPVRRRDADESQLLAWARARLGPSHRPRSVVFQRELPRNPAGKVLRRTLAGDPDGDVAAFDEDQEH